MTSTRPLRFLHRGRVVEIGRMSPMTTVLDWLRLDQRLTGTKEGCGEGDCGACMVLVDGGAEPSCLVRAAQVRGRAVTTIEGLAADGSHPLQQAWVAEDVPQCGYCQAGQIMGAAALLAAHPAPTDAQIDAAMAGNVCRCGTYVRIRAAIHRAAKEARA